jgi:hypothetical protein
VWMMPGLAETERSWEHNRSPAVAVRSEQWEVLHVYHVGEGGTVWGPQAAGRFRNSSVDGLLDAWLNLQSGTIRFTQAPEEIRFLVPRFQDGQTRKEENRQEDPRHQKPARAGVDNGRPSGAFL